MRQSLNTDLLVGAINASCESRLRSNMKDDVMCQRKRKVRRIDIHVRLNPRNDRLGVVRSGIQEGKQRWHNNPLNTLRQDRTT
jgi:hypothetical protein